MRGQESPQPERGEDDFLGAARGFLAVEDQPYGTAGRDAHGGGRVGAPDNDVHVLDATGNLVTEVKVQ